MAARAANFGPGLGALLLETNLDDATGEQIADTVEALGTAIAAGVPVPAFSSALAYYDGYRRERGPANLIQGLRDYFGAHTYRRVDAFGAFHTRWAQDGAQVKTS